MAFAWRPAMAPIETPAPNAFAPELVAKGKVLADHHARPSQAAFAA